MSFFLKVLYSKNKEVLEKIEIRELKAKNYHIENELSSLKLLREDLIEKWKDALVRIKELEKDNEMLIISYENKIK